MNKEIIMNNTIKTIALSVSVAFLSSAALAGGGHHVQVNTGLQDTLDLLAQNATNGSALNLAINTNSIDATVNTAGGINNLGDIETSAIGAVNTGNITLQQGNVYKVLGTMWVVIIINNSIQVLKLLLVELLILNIIKS